MLTGKKHHKLSCFFGKTPKLKIRSDGRKGVNGKRETMIGSIRPRELQ